MPRAFLAGTGEKMQYLVHEFNDNTIRFLLHYPGVLDVQALRDAARAVIDRAEILHASFHPGAIGVYWHVQQDYEDSSFFHHVQVTGDPVPTAFSLSALPILPESRTQLRCTLVQNSAESVVVLSVSHLCADGSDGRYLLEKLCEGYRLLRETGSCATLMIKNGSRKAEQVYENLDLPEIVSLMKSPMTGVKSVFPLPTDREGLPGSVRRTIPPETMAAARTRAKTAGATANDVLLTACYHAFAALPGMAADAPASIMSMLDLRRHCTDGESEGLCNMSGSLPTVLRQGIHATFSETLQEIAAQTASVKEDPLAGLMGMPLLHGATRTLPMWLLLMAASRLYGSMSVGLTNLGVIPCDTLAMDGLTPDRGWFGGPLKKKPSVQVSAASFGGACALCIFGRFTQEDATVLQGFLDRIAAEIEAYGSHA